HKEGGDRIRFSGIVSSFPLLRADAIIKKNVAEKEIIVWNYGLRPLWLQLNINRGYPQYINYLLSKQKNYPDGKSPRTIDSHEVFKYRKSSGKDGVIMQVVWSNQPVLESVRRG
ncbi:hypothetical protein J7E85_04200, partial [Paenibacillus sp. ISL-20]|nr:hypothetical protein [Paenibacillus sp. ISL-20]